MKIILRADVENLGHLGDVVSVKPGYGRNYLLPQGLAMLATPANLKVFELERKKLQARMDALRAEANEHASRLEGLVLVIAMRVGENDKLYGSVTSSIIGDALAEQGVDVMNVTAYKMLDAMRNKYLGEDGAEFDRMLSCAFLAVDDLGVEPMMRNITAESLFMLLNERMNARLCTIFATNLTPAQLKERYGERIASRLFDRENGAFLRFVGKDLRAQNG